MINEEIKGSQITSLRSYNEYEFSPSQIGQPKLLQEKVI